MTDKRIMTVSGLIAPAELGITSMHDHIMFDGSVLGKRLRGKIPPNKLPIREDENVSLENVGMLQRNTILAWDALNQDDEAAMLEEVKLFKRAGGDAILELSVPGILLDTEAEKRISEATGVHVIVSTGFYTADSRPAMFHGMSVAQFREHMRSEIKHGVGGTSIRPGHIKIGVSMLDADEENSLRAAAQVGAETGLSLTIHPGGSAGGAHMRILQICKEEGMDLTRVVMAHTGFTIKPPLAEVIRNPSSFKVSLDLAKAMLDIGCTISTEFLNTMGLELTGGYDSGDWSKWSGLIQVIDQGYCKQIVIGNDCCAKIMLHNFGGEGFCRMLYYTIPMLRNAAGISDYAIRQITVENPRRILAY
jgi:phosphotriesterase-related protein